MRKKLLLHQCCAICSAVVLKDFMAEFDVDGIWFNPNIHPEEESFLRLDALEKFNALNGVKTINLAFPYTESFSSWIAGVRKYSDRCEYCYYTRLEKTMSVCAENGYEYVSTTLFSSPYQNFDLIKKIGESLAHRYKVKFVSKDVRNRYFMGKSEIGKLGLYRQKYCGCIFSKNERTGLQKNFTAERTGKKHGE